MKFAATCVLSGLLFALGLGISGMTKPEKVLGFLDFFGAWDPSLALVMVGAIGVNSAAYNGFVHGGSRPMFADQVHLPARTRIDARLVFGAAIFGVGWGLGGYCPGPAIVALWSQGASAAVFVGAMFVGMWLFTKVEGLLSG